MAEKQYDIGFGCLGNGTTVWNRLEEVDNDYKTIAHISEDGKEIKYYEELPNEIKHFIGTIAGALQDTQAEENENDEEIEI